MHTLLSQNDLLKTAAEKARFLEEVVAAHYLALVKKDVQKAVNLFIAYFDTQSEAVFERLTGHLAPEPEWLFRFLKLTLFEGRLNYSKSQLANGGGGAENLGGGSSSNNNSNNSSSSESHRKIFKLCTNGTLQERYLELAAQLEPATILAVLDVLSEVADSAALRICRAAGVKEGEAYVYERLKQYPAAFNLLLEDFKGTVNESIQYTFNHLNSSGGGSGKKSSQKSATESGGSSSNPSLPSFAAIDGKFTRLLDFCKRAFGRHSSGAKNEAFCLATLEFLIHTKTALNGVFKMRDDEVDDDGGEGEGGGGHLLPQYLHLLAEPSRRPQIEALIGHYNHRFRLLFEKLVSVMLRHFSLLDLFDFIVKKVLVNESSGTSHGGGGGENLYDVREMLLVILENYHYEKSLLELVNSMLGGEHHQLTSRFQAANVRSRNVRQAHCGLCLRPTTTTTATSLTSPSNIVLFSCAHLFHEHCFEEKMKGGRRRKREDQLQQQQRLCPLCNSHLMRGKGGGGGGGGGGDGGGKEEEHEEGEEDEEGEEESDQSRRAAVTGKQQQQQQSQQQQLLLNETQFRALNYFHHGRLGPGRAGGRRSRRQ